MLAFGGVMLTTPRLAFAQTLQPDWDWTDDELFRIEGTIREIYIGEPEARLLVDAEGDSEGEVWEVVLAEPARTAASGLTEDIARIGDHVAAVGSRSKDHSEMRMKASRITINERNYDIYPSRVPAG